MRRFAKPLYGLTPVPRVRIPPSPPDTFQKCFLPGSRKVAVVDRDKHAIIATWKPTWLLPTIRWHSTRAIADCLLLLACRLDYLFSIPLTETSFKSFLR